MRTCFRVAATCYGVHNRVVALEYAGDKMAVLEAIECSFVGDEAQGTVFSGGKQLQL